MNDKEKSLRWVANMIPEFEPKTEEEKMLLAIKRYCLAGANEIYTLEERLKITEEAFRLACRDCGRTKQDFIKCAKRGNYEQQRNN